MRTRAARGIGQVTAGVDEAAVAGVTTRLTGVINDAESAHCSTRSCAWRHCRRSSR